MSSKPCVVCKNDVNTVEQRFLKGDSGVLCFSCYIFTKEKLALLHKEENKLYKPMVRDLGDVLDRHSIAKLKAERIGSEDSIRECEAFEEHIRQDCVRREFDGMMEGDSISHTSIIDEFANLLLKLNGFIWDMESALKSGKDGLPEPHYLFATANTNQLAQIGTIAILIRNINSLRVDVKNMVNAFAKEGFRDAKKDHLSE